MYVWTHEMLFGTMIYNTLYYSILYYSILSIVIDTVNWK